MAAAGLGWTPLTSAAPAKQVLVFTKTAGFRHSSIPQGIAAIQQLGRSNGFAVTATEDAAKFTPGTLANYQAVIFLSTTGDVLDGTQQSALESYIGGGGGFVGIHAAADTEYEWPWYGRLVGAYFADHPAIQPASLNVEDRTNPATAHLGGTWQRTDEWYNFRTNPRSSVRVLLSLNEQSYAGGTMGDHPITWCQNYGGGRSFYTGLGHSGADFSDDTFSTLLLGGIRIAAGWVAADCAPSTPTVVALRARANNKLVAAENAGSAALIANRTAVGPWEQFDLVALGGADIALRAHANNSYVCAEAAGNSPLISNRAAIGAWETFALVRHSDGTVSFVAAANGKYVTAEAAGTEPLIANRTAIGVWETFDLIGA